MQVKSRLQINIFVLILMAVIAALTFSVATYSIGRAMDKLQIADQIITGVLERAVFRSDYLRNRNERARIQWFAVHKQVGSLFTSAKKKFKDTQDQIIIDDMIKTHESIGKLFSAIVENREKIGPGVDTTLSQQIETRLITQINMRLYATVLHARQLLGDSRESLFATLRMTGWSIACVLLIGIIAVIINTWAMTQTLINRIRLLREGAATIGNGNLEHIIKIESNDEFIELSGAFNAMTTKLRGSYNNLENEVKDRKHAEQALLESEQQLKALNENLERIVTQRTQQVHDLSKALTVAEQRERQRFSQVLHEDLQQTLFSAKMQIDAVDCKSPQGMTENIDDIAQVKHFLEKAITTTRSLAIELNPPILKREGLDVALNWLARYMEERYGLVTCVDISNNLSVIKDIDQILIVQLTRELLFNVVKYAGTKEVLITGKKDQGNIQIIVEDKGVGFDVDTIRTQGHATAGMGIFSIEERLRLFGGTLEIKSEPHKGTRATIIMPISEESVYI